jgi:hypothetical protein
MSQTARLALLLSALILCGGANYRRNAAADASAFRPYRGISDAELALLIDAQQDATKAAESAWKRGSPARAKAVGGDDLMRQVRDFERAREVSQRKNALALRAAGGAGDLERMERERNLRARQGVGWRRWLYFATQI